MGVVATLPIFHQSYSLNREEVQVAKNDVYALMRHETNTFHLMLEWSATSYGEEIIIIYTYSILQLRTSLGSP